MLGEMNARWTLACYLLLMLLTTEWTKKGTSVSKRVKQRDCETGGGREAEVGEASLHRSLELVGCPHLSSE